MGPTMGIRTAMRLGRRRGLGKIHVSEAKEGGRALGSPPRGCLTHWLTPAVNGRDRVAPSGSSSKVGGDQKRSALQEGAVPVSAVATKCPRDWPPAVTSDCGKIPRYVSCYL